MTYRRYRRLCLISTIGTLTVVTLAAAAVVALPRLVVIPDSLVVGAGGLGGACLAIVAMVGYTLTPWLYPPRRRPAQPLT